MPKRLKHIGVDSFFAERKKLLDTYDQAKQQATDDKVKTEHGVTAEALVRKWLRSFLPKRFGVCKGYIITTNLEYEGPIEEWDVIVYDSIESPILYTVGIADQSDSEKKRAIPVEHVRAVIEVKATLTSDMAKKAADKLLKLTDFIGVSESPAYPQYLCLPSVCTAIFFETKVNNLKEYRQALDNLCVLFKTKPEIPFMGALVLRNQRESTHSGYLKALCSDTPIVFPDEAEMSSGFQYSNGKYGLFGCFGYGVNFYPQFVFDFLASIKGTLTNRASSFYGFDFEKTQGSRLFH